MVHLNRHHKQVKYHTTVISVTLRQENRLVQDADFDPNCTLRGEKLTLIEANNRKFQFDYGTEVVFGEPSESYFINI